MIIRSNFPLENSSLYVAVIDKERIRVSVGVEGKDNSSRTIYISASQLAQIAIKTLVEADAVSPIPCTEHEFLQAVANTLHPMSAQTDHIARYQALKMLAEHLGIEYYEGPDQPLIYPGDGQKDDVFSDEEQDAFHKRNR